MRIVVAAMVTALVGCAAPYAQQSTFQTTSAASYRASLFDARAERDSRKRRLSEARLQEEIDRLAKEIRELELRISELEWQVEDAERRESVTTPPSTPSSGCYTGPRGGRYTISKSGKKNYGGC